MILLENVTKRHSSGGGVRGISCRIAPGTVVGLLGRNGSGKSTLLSLVLGVLSPESGAVTVFGCRPDRDRRRIAEFSGFQHPPGALERRATPRECLELHARFYEHPESADALLARFGLTAQADQLVETLSTGERQRTLLAIALVNRPRLLVLDEPEAALSSEIVPHLAAAAAEVRARNGIVVWASHDLRALSRVCDQVLFLRDGELALDNHMEDFRAQFGDRFLLTLAADEPAPVFASAAAVFPESYESDQGRHFIVRDLAEIEAWLARPELAAHATALGGFHVSRLDARALAASPTLLAQFRRPDCEAPASLAH